MEVGSQGGACVDYDVEGGRLLVVTAAGRTEIHVRPQVHRLARFMAERNASSSGAPVLCSNDELMHAVWGDEAMHTHTELAKLIWELRRELEPLGASEVVVNERRRGYRLVTCGQNAAAAPAGTGRTRWVILAVTALVVALAGAVVLVARDSGGDATSRVTANEDIVTFVDRIENVLEQSAAGRREIGAALGGGFNCSISPDEAARRIASVADNRQSILQQLGSLAAPTPEAARAVTLLQRALQQSIEADRHYRDGFLEVQAGARCPLSRNPSFDLAAASDRRATLAKKAFVVAFDSLARTVGRPRWSPLGF